jgi:eukaryotic-like serine/threonine-protein kinase
LGSTSLILELRRDDAYSLVTPTSDAQRLDAALGDRYRVERELGAGGMATVYLAHDLKHDRKVALKVLKPELAAVIGAERFLREIKTIASLQHPHILGLIDSGEVDGTAFYVMPFVEGESLRDLLKREKQLPIADAVRIATEVAAALDYAHRHGVIHRDIKPENILLHDGQALVADFGIALAVSTAGGTRMTETGMSLGTPHYMSPEQALGEREITARSDVYALGCVLYEMLVGEPPFTGPTAQAIIAKVMTAEPVSLATLRRTVPFPVESAVLTALQKLPADRFATAARFAEALTSTAVPAQLDNTAHAGAATGWRSPGVRGAILVVAAAAIAAIAFLVGRMRQTGSSVDHVAFVQRTFASQAVFTARFTRDGETIVYSAAAEGNTPRIYVIRSESPEPRALSAPGTHLLAVSSRDEMAVLVNVHYLGFRLFNGTLARMPLGGGAPRELLTNVREADWSPDGSELAIIHEVNGKDRLEFPLGTVLFESTGYLSDVRVSPKADRLAFLEHPLKYDDRGVVGVVDLHGKHHVLTDEYWGLQGLAWSTDGGRILFGGAVGPGFYQIHSVSLAGGDRLTLPSAGTLTMHDVAASGRWLVTRDDQMVRLFVKPPGAPTEVDYSWLELTNDASMSRDGAMVAFTNSGSDAGSTYQSMVRSTDGSPAVRIGEGGVAMLSPDKHWVLSTVLSVPPRLMLYPVGPGQSRRLDAGELQSYDAAAFFPDGANLLLCGSERGYAARCYVRAVSAGPLRAITPEGTLAGAAISPDGRTVLVATFDGYRMYPLDGGPARPVPGLSVDERVVRWSPNGHSIWITHGREVPLRVEELDLATGRRRPLMSVEPRNRAGVVSTDGISFADDPRAYAYSAREHVSRIFVVQGMR